MALVVKTILSQTYQYLPAQSIAIVEQKFLMGHDWGLD